MMGAQERMRGLLLKETKNCLLPSRGEAVWHNTWWGVAGGWKPPFSLGLMNQKLLHQHKYEFDGACCRRAALLLLYSATRWSPCTWVDTAQLDTLVKTLRNQVILGWIYCSDILERKIQAEVTKSRSSVRLYPYTMFVIVTIDERKDAGSPAPRPSRFESWY